MKKIELETRVIDFIQQHNLISSGEIVVVGVSGGADSVCLLCVLARWQSKLDIKLHVAHLNHQLRGVESETDAKYVANLAERLDIPITVGKRDVAAYKAERNCSMEEAARELRYDFLAKVADDIGANRVAIGHTRDDQVETILMHILRGTGTSGLRGLEPCSPIPYGKGMSLRAQRSNLLVIRPLLNITREGTLNYCQERQIEPRIDSSNLSLSFFRNRLRLELLPLLREYNPSVDQALLRLAEIAGSDISYLEQQAFQLWDEVARQEEDAIYLDKGKIVALPIALQRQLLRLAIARLAGDTRDIEANHIEAIRSLLSKPVGKRTSLPHGLVCWNRYDEVVIAVSQSLEGNESTRDLGLSTSRLFCPFPALQGEFPLKVPGETVLPGWRVIASISSVIPRQSPEHSESRSPFVIASEAKQPHRSFVAEFDLHLAGTELFVRQRQPGDGFQPLGMDRPKKLQHFMVDAKIPLLWREHIPIVCSPQQIIWVVGWRIDDRVKVTEATKEILRLEFIRL
ncbi:MAG: tRNA lysidine(34) synthetase TilS [Dehalococcoidia bacterium]|nr:tRNA lysidine(34) synthetase TilS [Dehalococcoidia bacterium]